MKVPPLTNFCINRAGNAVVVEEPSGNIYLFEITEDDLAIVSKLIYTEHNSYKSSTGFMPY